MFLFLFFFLMHSFMLPSPSEFWRQVTYFLFSKGPTSNSDLNMNRTRDKRAKTFQQSGLSQYNILGISFSFSVYFLFFDSFLAVYDKISSSPTYFSWWNPSSSQQDPCQLYVIVCVCDLDLNRVTFVSMGVSVTFWI